MSETQFFLNSSQNQKSLTQPHLKIITDHKSIVKTHKSNTLSPDRAHPHFNLNPKFTLKCPDYNKLAQLIMLQR